MRSIRRAAGILAPLVLSACSRNEPIPPSYSALTGAEIREAVARLRGHVVVLNLWATWCEPCRKEFPALVRLAEAYREHGVRVIAVSVDDPDDVETKVKPFVRDVGATFPIWLQAPGDPMEFQASLNPDLSLALPETIVYGPDGDVVVILRGEQTYEQFEEAVRNAFHENER